MADARISEQHTPTAVGLQAMFVRIDNDGIHPVQLIEPVPRFRRKIAGQSKVAAVRAIGMHAEAKLSAKFQNLREWIDGTRRGGSHGRNHGANIAALQARSQRIEAHPPKRVTRHGFKIQLQYATDS